MQNNKDEKERKLSQAFLNPTIERLKKWIKRIEKTSLDSSSNLVKDECNKKHDKANEGLNAIYGYYEGIYDYSVVQKALAECKHLGFH